MTSASENGHKADTAVIDQGSVIDHKALVVIKNQKSNPFQTEPSELVNIVTSDMDH